MAISLTPHTLSVINWQKALDDPIRLQFLPLRSGFVTDHPSLTLDSLHEEADSRMYYLSFFLLPLLLKTFQSRGKLQDADAAKL